MAKINPSVELIEAILIRIPEGFIHRSILESRIRLNRKNTSQLLPELAKHAIGSTDKYYYDSRRISENDVLAKAEWCRPSLPRMLNDGRLPDAPILQRQEAHAELLAQYNNPLYRQVLNHLPEGYGLLEALFPRAEDQETLKTLLGAGLLRQKEAFVYDPLRLSPGTLEEINRRYRLAPIQEAITAYLESKLGQTTSREDLEQRFDSKLLRELLSMGVFPAFNVSLKYPPYTMQWIRLKTANAALAKQTAQEALQIPDEKWASLLSFCGDADELGTQGAKSFRSAVLAHSYTINSAAKKLDIHPHTLEEAIHQGLVPSFIDPESVIRVTTREIDKILDDVDYRERVSAFEEINPKHIILVGKSSRSTIQRHLRKRMNGTRPMWEEVRGRWGLPETLPEFKAILKAQIREWRENRAREREESEQEQKVEREAERQRRAELRAKLVAAFPTWRHEGRNEQHITLHTGTPNSGKTHDALNALIDAGEGWYLAPLRLLAFEIFDELNQLGVYCNLLTGEENIHVPGAKITAATIEMFNPKASGDCVIIDEAQMLADPDRGWAWTRALMEVEAPDIHVIGPPTIKELVQQLAESAAIPISVVEHQRLSPIKVAEKAWPLHKLPPSTILIAFSRFMVLQLKATLEEHKRSVSVIYGNLPPEVRRRQVRRFINGQTDICVATDAVGMGINLPADHVCFYEIEKFDGKETRLLTPNEVQQIGGRAGRYGLSISGEVGATNRHDLQTIRQLFYADASAPTHARVAPTAEDIQLLSGNLAHRLTQWAALESIPDSLRNVIKTADLKEQITLAGMLHDHEVNQLGLEAALRLVAAPTRESNHAYWRECASAIIAGEAMPLPPKPPRIITSSNDLESTEMCVTCADIYLWLAHRREFRLSGPDEPEVREMRLQWSMQIDDALLKKLDSTRHCQSCGRVLPRNHQFRICNSCFYQRHRH